MTYVYDLVRLADIKMLYDVVLPYRSGDNITTEMA